MHIKFLARGSGSARAAADYLLGARDATGRPREGVEVLWGDPIRWPRWPTRFPSSTGTPPALIAWAP